MLPRAFFLVNSNPLTANPVPCGYNRMSFSLSVLKVERDDMLTTSGIIILGHVIKYSLWDGPDIKSLYMLCWPGEFIIIGIILRHPGLW
jgi:hypothetical protein